MSTTHPPRVTSPPSTATLRAELRVAVSDLLDRNLSQSSKWAAQLLHSLPQDLEAPIDDEDEEVEEEELEHDARRDHVHFRTSTPVKSSLTASSHLLQHPAVTNLIGGHSPSRARPRESVGSVMSFGPASSPAFPTQPRQLDLDDEQMLPTASTSTSTTTTVPGHGRPRAPKRKREWVKRDEHEHDVYLLGLSLARNHELMRAAHALRRCKGAKARWLRVYSKFLVSFIPVELNHDLCSLSFVSARSRPARSVRSKKRASLSDRGT